MTRKPKVMAYDAEGVSLTNGLFVRYMVELLSYCHRCNQKASNLQHSFDEYQYFVSLPG